MNLALAETIFTLSLFILVARGLKLSAKSRRSRASKLGWLKRKTKQAKIKEEFSIRKPVTINQYGQKIGTILV